MDDSILVSVRKLLGYGEESTPFDSDFIIDINTVFGILTQLGIGPADGFTISGDSTMWSEFVESTTLISLVKSYMVLRVRLLFDPPTNSVVTELLTNQYKEMEWRLVIASQTTTEETT